jgi:hypothetical protein
MGGGEARTQGALVSNEIRARPVILNADALRRTARSGGTALILERALSGTSLVVGTR